MSTGSARDFDSRFVGHIPVRVNDIDQTRDFYARTLGLRHSGTAGLREDAINVMTRDAICFMSCGDLHHDFAGFQAHDSKFQVVPVTPDDFHHLSFTLRPETSLDAFREHLHSLGVDFDDGASLPDPTGTYDAENCVTFRDPNGHFVEVHSADIDADVHPNA